MNVYCDDGSTTIKLAWNDNGKICKSLSQNSFRHGWKVDGLGIRQTFNYELDGKKYTYDEVSNQSILTTHIEYQYTDVNLLAVHHALLNSGLAPQPVSLTVTLPISEFYTKECQKNELNIQRKIENLMRPIRLNKGDVFTIEHVDVMPESLPAVFSRLVVDKVGQFEKSLVVDIGGTTLDVGVIVGQFDSVSAIHGNSGIGVSSVTKAAMMTIKEGIRILSGMILVTSEITRLDITSTNAVASPIPMPLIAEVVTPKVGHIPNKSAKVGFSLNMPLVKTFKLFIELEFLF